MLKITGSRLGCDRYLGGKGGGSQLSTHTVYVRFVMLWTVTPAEVQLRNFCAQHWQYLIRCVITVSTVILYCMIQGNLAPGHHQWRLSQFFFFEMSATCHWFTLMGL